MSYRGRFLAEGFTDLPSLGAAVCRQLWRGSGRCGGLRILAFGNPDLENEALDLQFGVEERKDPEVGDTTVLLREQATEAKVGEMPAGYDILHFAVRGQFFPKIPWIRGCC